MTKNKTSQLDPKLAIESILNIDGHYSSIVVIYSDFILLIIQTILIWPFVLNLTIEQ